MYRRVTDCVPAHLSKFRNMPPVLLFIPLKQIFLSPRQREIDSLCKVHIDHRSSNGLCQFDCLYGGLQIRLPDFWIKITDIQILVEMDRKIQMFLIHNPPQPVCRKFRQLTLRKIHIQFYKTQSQLAAQPGTLLQSIRFHQKRHTKLHIRSSFQPPGCLFQWLNHRDKPIRPLPFSLSFPCSRLLLSLSLCSKTGYPLPQNQTHENSSGLQRHDHRCIRSQIH